MSVVADNYGPSPYAGERFAAGVIVERQAKLTIREVWPMRHHRDRFVREDARGLIRHCVDVLRGRS